MALASYFIIIPGLWMLLAHVSKARGWDLFTVFAISLPVASIVAVAANPWHPHAAFALFAAGSAWGWIKGWRTLFDRVEHGLYLLAYPATRLEPGIFDVTMYQLRIPRDVHRFGLSAIDGTSFYHSLMGFPHLLLSAWGFDNQTLISAAIGMQAICAIAILRWIRDNAKEHPVAMALAWLGIPLTWILCQEALIDMLGIYITCKLLQVLATRSPTKGECLALGLTFGIKVTIPVLLAAPLALAIWQRRVTRTHLGLFIMTTLAIGCVQWSALGFFLFPQTYGILGEAQSAHLFSLDTQLNELAFHAQRFHAMEIATTVFWRVSPFFVPWIFWALRNRQSPLMWSVAGSLLAWWAAFPQERFLLYVVPLILIGVGSWKLPRSLSGVMLLCSLSLFSVRGLPSWWDLKLKPGLATLWNAPTPSLEDHLATDLPELAVVYSERGPEWNLPGRSIFVMLHSDARMFGDDWPTTFKALGVTHLILADQPTSNRPALMGTSKSLASHVEAFEAWKRQNTLKIKSLATPLATSNGFTLYQCHR
ncbi:MAG: hypothetical protein AB7F75_01450 [Planctomycetota bacterium]